MSDVCRYRHFFSHCRRPAIGSCQYCGLPFCGEHGSTDANDGQICVRDVCRRKQADLVLHLAFRERAHLRNRHGLCGIEACIEERWGQCSKCLGLFCEQHLQSHSETVRQGLASFTRPAAFCEHCFQRRKLWSKR